MSVFDFFDFAYAVNVIRKGYHPGVSLFDELVLGIFTLAIVVGVLFVRYKFSKELKKRGLDERSFRKRKKLRK